MLPKVKRSDEIGQMDNPKYCPYHQLINHSIKDCFVLKGKIQKLIDNGSISLLDGSIKAPLRQVSIKDSMLKTDEP